MLGHNDISDWLKTFTEKIWLNLAIIYCLLAYKEARGGAKLR